MISMCIVLFSCHFDALAEFGSLELNHLIVNAADIPGFQALWADPADPMLSPVILAQAL
jgi:hypothetical protein